MILKPIQTILEANGDFNDALVELGVDPTINKDYVAELRTYWDSVHFEQAERSTYEQKIIDLLDDKEKEFVDRGSLPLVYNDQVRANPELTDTPEALSRLFAFRNTCVIVYTREKMGKSTIITYDAAESALAGNKVIWFTAEEDVGSITTRMDRYIPEGGDRVPVMISPCWPKSLDEIRNTIKLRRPDYVIIDSLTSTMRNTSGKSYSAKDTQAFADYVLKFKEMSMEFNCALVIIHHANKGNGEYLGSVGIGMSADGVIRLLRAGKKEDRKMRKTAGGKEVEVDGMTGVERKLEEMGDNITQVSYSRCRWMDDYEQYVEYDKKTSKCSILNDEYDKNFIPAKLLFQYIKAEPRTRQECEFYFKGRGLNKMAFYGAKNKLELGRPVGGKYLIDDNYNAPDWCKNLPAYEEENSKVDVNDSFSIKGPKIVHSKDLANGDMSNAKEVIKEVSNEN